MHARYYDAGGGRFLSVDPVLDLKSATTKPQMWNRYSYVANNPVNAVDPDGRETYLVSRTLAFIPMAGAKVSLRVQVVSHTFIMTTSGGLNTYSWGNTPDGKTVGKWFKNANEDTAAAKEANAIDSKLVKTKMGDDSLDPYIQKAFDLDANKENDPSNHANGVVWGNCKTEARDLIEEAKRLRAEDQKRKQDEKTRHQKDVDDNKQQ
jgi:uncharacterized protein RhaS with RHS repeats